MFLVVVLVAEARTLVAEAKAITMVVRLRAADNGSLSTSEAGVAAGKVVATEAAVSRWDEQQETKGALLWGRGAFRYHGPRGQGAEQDIWRWMFPWRNDGPRDCPCRAGRSTLLAS